MKNLYENKIRIRIRNVALAANWNKLKVEELELLNIKQIKNEKLNWNI